jgi:8-oxo-dGTP diphosphatase
MIVSAAILLDARPPEKVLLALRGPSQSHAGMWEFPGGKVEVGESPEEALVREIREELNLEVSVGELLARAVSASLPGLELWGFACSIESGTITLREHAQTLWVSLDALTDYPMTHLDQQVVEQLRNRFCHV